MNAYTFRPALREETSVLVGFAGPSGSGKTLSALRVARGLAGGDDTKIFAIDTEQGRMLHYACASDEKPGPFKFRFNHLRLNAPFSPEAYANAIQAARAAGAKVIIVDSMSHEHEGEGGILEWHEREMQKMAGDDYAKRERVKFTAWIVPKAAHNKLVSSILQQPCHMIFCFRAKDKLALIKDDKGKIQPVKVGWTAICSDRFEYEMTCLLMLPPNAKGVPDLGAEQTKIQEQHRAFFPPSQPITEKSGEQLAAWAKGGVAVEKPKREPTQPGALTAEKAIEWANKVIGKMDLVTDARKIDDWLEMNKEKLAQARAADSDAAMAVVSAAEGVKRKLTHTQAAE